MAGERREATFQQLLDEGLLEIGDGYRAQNNELGGTGRIFLRAGHVTDTHIDFTDVEHFHEHLAGKVRSKMSKVGDTIITTKGNSTGRTSFVTDRLPPFVYSPHLSYWRSRDPEKLCGGFLRYWSQGVEFIEQLSGMKASTDMAPYLSFTDQRRHSIPLRPLAEQKAIAAVLGALDDKIELNRRMNATLEAMARALFQSWFIDFDSVRANLDRNQPSTRPVGHPSPTGRRAGDEGRFALDPATAALFPDHLEDSPLGHIPKGWEVVSLEALASIRGGKQLPTEDCLPAGKFTVFGANGIMGYATESTHDGFVITFGRVGAYCGSIHWSLDGAWIKDTAQGAFQFAVPELVMEELHQIDLGAGGLVSIPEPITNPQTRDRYLVSSLMEEAITSSQLEGAVTTREVAKEMIRSGRKPRDNSEQMILNNYVTMQRIRALKASALSPELVFEVHRLVTEQTLDDPTATGRFRRANEKRVVGDDYGQVYHDPPPAEELTERMAAMCAFANGESPGYFVHPAVRAIILHFWLAYDHPFVDGNGRTARALFYWAMLHSGYWLFEFISISSILRKAPVKYGRSFLYSETDDNDLTYFIIAQTQVIRRAIRELHTYIERKTAELKDLESYMRALDLFNHRQVEIIRNAFKHPGQRYTFASHQKSRNVVYQTARTDLLDLGERGVLEKRKKGKQMIFVAPADLSARLLKLEKEAGV